MIKEINYSELSLRVHKASAEKNIPLDGTIELTSHCNLNCKHCYIRDNSTENQLAYEEICRVLDEISEAGCLWLLLTGGEPLTRDDFYDIYKKAKQKGMLITLFTNGTLITEETAIFLKKWRPFSVEITLYGATRETYESMTGVAGSYDACVNGIQLLTRHEVPLSLKTMVTTINKHEVPEMKKFAESFGLRFKYDPIINPRLDGTKSPYEVRLTADEVVDLDMNDSERTKEWGELYEKFNGPASNEYLFNCGAGRCGFHITASGRLWVCGFVPLPDHDLRNNGFMSGYRKFAAVRGKRLTGGKNCAGCEYAIFCDSCPGKSILEGDKSGESPVDYLCAVAHKRSKQIKRRYSSEKKETLCEAGNS